MRQTRLLSGFETVRRVARADSCEWRHALGVFVPEWRIVTADRHPPKTSSRQGELLTLRVPGASLVVFSCPAPMSLTPAPAEVDNQAELCILGLDGQNLDVRGQVERNALKDTVAGPAAAVHELIVEPGQVMVVLSLDPDNPATGRMPSGLHWQQAVRNFLTFANSWPWRYYGQLVQYFQGLCDRIRQTDPNQDVTYPLVSRSIDPRAQRVFNHLRAPDTLQFDPDRLAALACTSRRALYSLIKRHSGFSPYQLFLHRRLYDAHYQLLTSPGATISVSDLAITHGFNHLSRFAARYHALFGELPSVTLKRRREHLTIQDQTAPTLLFAPSTAALRQGPRDSEILSPADTLSGVTGELC